MALQPVAAAFREREVGIERESAVDLGMAKEQHGPTHLVLGFCLETLVVQGHPARCNRSGGGDAT